VEFFLIIIYDIGGNIVLKETRNLSTNVLTGTDTYAYNCSQWRDQLTAYDGAVISYDNAGNPLLYRGATLT